MEALHHTQVGKKSWVGLQKGFLMKSVKVLSSCFEAFNIIPVHTHQKGPLPQEHFLMLATILYVYSCSLLCTYCIRQSDIVLADMLHIVVMSSAVWLLWPKYGDITWCHKSHKRPAPMS